MTMLTTIQRFCRRTSLAVPTTVYGSSDEQVLQILALLEEEGTDLSGRGSWERLTFEATHTTVATESQGEMTTIASNNFRFVKNETAWDRTENLPLYVIDGQDWQAEKGFSTTSPRYRIRIRGGELLATPTPAAGNTWAFEYVSWNWILDNDGSTYKQYFTEDTDSILLPEPIVLMGLRWRWKKEKGLDYEEDFNTYEEMVTNELGRQGVKKTLHQDMDPRDKQPHIVVNQGNWNL
jgi:hypothetical protein